MVSGRGEGEKSARRGSGAARGRAKRDAGTGSAGGDAAASGGLATAADVGAAGEGQAHAEVAARWLNDGELLTVPINSILGNPRNPRIHGEDQIERLVASIKKFGRTAPIVVRKANLMVIAGHARLEAQKRLGYETVDVLAMDVGQDEADRMMLADNRLAQLARDDETMMAAMLGQLDEGELYPLGFDLAEASHMQHGMQGRVAKVREIPVSDVADTFWLVVKGPMQHQADALQSLRALMGRLEGVTVDMGSTSVDFAL